MVDKSEQVGKSTLHRGGSPLPTAIRLHLIGDMSDVKKHDGEGESCLYFTINKLIFQNIYKYLLM